jgi:hypothetical protein
MAGEMPAMSVLDRHREESERRRLDHPRRWIVAVAAAVMLLTGGVLAGGWLSLSPPAILSALSASASSSLAAPPSAAASFPTDVNGLTVQSVSELLAARSAGNAPHGPYALRGYWTDRAYGHFCNPGAGGDAGQLEIQCHDGEWGITELDEAILTVDINQLGDSHSTAAAGPNLTPWVAPNADTARLFASRLVPGLTWAPIPIVVMGHFDDPRAAACRPDARQTCLDRFVIDQVVQFDPGSVPVLSPSPSGSQG